MSKKIRENLIERPPVVVVMGHIDHGKSTLLDFIRKTNVVENEAGSITQHISAYEVLYEKNKKEKKKITFIDTPGHAAFSNVRATGVCLADIAILIISAEDGVKPQTIEAYKSIQESNIPVVVAINKIDKQNANVEKIKQELLENEIFLEGLGGNIPFNMISAKTGQGVSELLETVLLVADMEELTGNQGEPASGFVLESKINTQKGTEITAIIKNGRMKKGDFIVINNKVSPIRGLENVLGEPINEATFSNPIKLIGIKAVPETGTSFVTFLSKKEAENFISNQVNKSDVLTKRFSQKINTSDNEEKTKILIIIKADVSGTIDAIQQEIKKIEQERADIQIISAGVGDINENDIKLAGNKGDVLIVGFNVKINQQIKSLAERSNIKIVIVDVIYKLTEWLEENIKNLIPKIKVEEQTGSAKIMKLFSKSKDGQIIGGKVKEGKIILSSDVKILRRDYEIGKGIIINLQKQKIQVKEVSEGDEFGMNLKSKIDVASGDVLSAYKIIEK